jgi:hypothetical protein
MLSFILQASEISMAAKKWAKPHVETAKTVHMLTFSSLWIIKSFRSTKFI